MAAWQDRWKQAIADGWAKAQPLPTPKKRKGLPGTKLKGILASAPFWIKVEHSGCKCQDRANQMDAWGVSGCRANRDQIVAWLTESAIAKGWPFASVGAAWLVDRAITLAARDEGSE